MAFGTPFTKAQLNRIKADDVADHGADETGEWTDDDGRHATGTTTMSIRLPISVLAALKDAALDENIGATVLARRCIMERLATQQGMDGGVVAVADLLELVARAQTPPPASAPPPTSGAARVKPRMATAEKPSTASSGKPNAAAAASATAAPAAKTPASRRARAAKVAAATPAAKAPKAAKSAKSKGATKVGALSR